MRRKQREALDLFEANGYNELATYNSERARGLVHTDGWKIRMRVRQERFNAEQRAEAERKGVAVFGPRGRVS